MAVSPRQIDKPEDSSSRPAMTPQQQRIAAGSSSALATYKDVMVGSAGWGHFSLFEFYNLVLSNLPSAAGYAARALLLPSLLGRCAKGPAVGRGVILRQPRRMRFGRSVVFDDYVTVDYRSRDTETGESGIDIGDHVFVGRHSTLLTRGGRLQLGDACNIGSHCRVATDSSVTIGASTLVAAYAYIGPANHRSDDPEKSLIEADMEAGKGVVIGDHCWIGARATIMDGVTIGEGAIVGAHSLVKDDVPAGAIVAGTPAKVLRTRD